MGVRILSGNEGSCFYCSCADWCFGPLMGSVEEAELFFDYLKRLGFDPRQLSDSDMNERWSDFRIEFCCAYCGSFIEEEEKCYEGIGSDKDSKFCNKHRDKGRKVVWHEGLEWLDEETKRQRDHEEDDCDSETCKYCKKENKTNGCS